MVNWNHLDFLIKIPLSNQSIERDKKYTNRHCTRILTQRLSDSQVFKKVGQNGCVTFLKKNMSFLKRYTSLPVYRLGKPLSVVWIACKRDFFSNMDFISLLLG